MFEMTETGRVIAARRREKNMTQMELADAMGVSFQAVSNWERGNSMPDIAKLPDLSRILGISVDALLSGRQAAELVQHVLDGDAQQFVRDRHVPPETIAEAAPILKPRQTESLLRDTIEAHQDTIQIRDLVALAPFISEEILESYAMKASAAGKLSDIVPLAPFLSEDALDHLVGTPDLAASVSDLVPLAPFLSEDTLNRLAASALGGGKTRIADLIPLAPFLSEDTLGLLTDAALEGADPNELLPLAPFLPKETLARCADSLMARFGVKGILGIAPFL